MIRPLAKLFGGCAGGIGLLDRCGHTLLQFQRHRSALIGGEIDKALGEIGVAGIERRLDFMNRDTGVEGAHQPAVGDRHRIIGGLEQRLRLESERHTEQRRQREQAGGEPCQSGVRANHSVPA